MSDQTSQFGALHHAAVPDDDSHMSAGAMLRQARESHGLHIDAVAAAMKVSPRKIEALEDDNIDELPDPVFARALAASVCRALRIDPAPVLARLPGRERIALANADRSISSSFRTDGSRAAWRPSRLLLMVVALLLLGAGVMVLTPQSAFDAVGNAVRNFIHGGDATVTTGGPETPPAETNPPPAAPPNTGADSILAMQSGAVGATAASTNTIVTATALAATTDPTGRAAAASAPTAAVPPSATPSAASAGATSAVPPKPPVATAAPTPPGTNPLSFKATADSWVSVTDARGTALLKRVVKAGETVGVAGTLPLSVVVGRSDGIEVEVLGKPFDLKAVTKGGGVARFEVKS